MKKLLAILLALVLVLALAVPAFAAETVIFETTDGEAFLDGDGNYQAPWGGFGIGPAVNGISVGNITIDDIRAWAEMGDCTLNLEIKCEGFWGQSPAPEVQFNCWDNEEALQVKFALESLNSGRYLATASFDTLVEKLEATGKTIADINNLGVQVWSEKFTLYRVWVETPEEEIVISDEEVMNAIEDQVGTLNGVSGGQQVMPLGDVVNKDETVVLHLVGTSDGPFRYWLSQNTWTSRSAITTVEDAEFDILVEVTATDNGANEVQFKGPYGGELNNLTLTRVGVFFGTMDEYDAAFEAKKAELIEAAKNAKTAGKYSGYLSTGDDYHMVIINSAVITTPHEYDDANVCVYCGHVGAEDEIIIEVTDPVEPSTDEEEDVTVDVEEPADEPAVEENPKTGLALAIIPMIVAAAAVVISKR